MAGLTSLFGAALLAAAAATSSGSPPVGEPLPAGAPTEPYPLAAWCYGAMSEYLEVYERVKPDLRAIDKMFGSSTPNEAEPYAADMRAARGELKVLAEAVQSAEKASPAAIAPLGVEAIKAGRAVWAPAESKTRRELARAWLSWAMPDRCDSTARSLAANSALLGQALKYNNAAATPPPPSAAMERPPAQAAAPPPPSAAPPADTQSGLVSPDPNGPLPDPVTPSPQP